MDLQKLISILSIEELIDLWRYLYITRYVLADPRLGTGGQQQIDRVKRQMRNRIRYIIYRIQNPNSTEIPLGLFNDGLNVDKWLDDNGIILNKSRVGPKQPDGKPDFFDYLVAKIHASKVAKWHEEMVKRSTPLTREELNEYIKILEERGVAAAESWLSQKGRTVDIIRTTGEDGNEYFLTKMSLRVSYNKDGTRTVDIVGGDLIQPPSIYDVMYEIKISDPVNFVDLIDSTPDLKQTRIEELLSDIVNFINNTYQSPLTGLDYYDLSKGSGSFELVENASIPENLIIAVVDELLNYLDVLSTIYDEYNLGDLPYEEKKRRIKEIMKDQMGVIGRAAYGSKYYAYGVYATLILSHGLLGIITDKYAGNLPGELSRKLDLLKDKVHHYEHKMHSGMNIFKPTKAIFAPGFFDSLLGIQSTEAKIADLLATILMMSSNPIGKVGVFAELVKGVYGSIEALFDESKKRDREKEAEQNRWVKSPYVNYGIKISLDSLYFVAAPAYQDIINAHKEVSVLSTDKIRRQNQHRVPRQPDANTVIYDFPYRMVGFQRDNTSVGSPIGPPVDLWPLTPMDRLNGGIQEMLNQNRPIDFHLQMVGFTDKGIPRPHLDTDSIPDLFDPSWNSLDIDWLFAAELAINQFNAGNASKEDLDAVLNFNNFVSRIHEEVEVPKGPSPIIDVDFIDENDYMNWFMDLELERFNTDFQKMLDTASDNNLVKDTNVGGIPIKQVNTKVENITQEKRESVKKKEREKGITLPNPIAKKTTPATNTEKGKTPPSPGKKQNGTDRPQNSKVYVNSLLPVAVPLASNGSVPYVISSKIPKTNKNIGNGKRQSRNDRNAKRTDAYNRNQRLTGKKTIPPNSDVEAIINNPVVGISNAPIITVTGGTARRGGGSAGGSGQGGGGKFGDPILDFNLRGGPRDIEFVETVEDTTETGGTGGGSDVPEKTSLACFPSWSKVHTMNGVVDIKDVKVGDYVTSFNADGSVFESKVIKVSHHSEKNEVFKYTLSNGVSVFITENHAVLTPENKFTNIGSLHIGDYLVMANGDNSSIVSKESVGYHETYNILTEKVGTYISDQIRVWGSDWFTPWGEK